MIKTFRHKGLSEIFESGTTTKVRQDLIARCRRRLDALNQAAALMDVNLPGFDFHPLKGKVLRYSIHVNGPWCITFEWIEGDAWRIDLEQYH